MQDMISPIQGIQKYPSHHTYDNRDAKGRYSACAYHADRCTKVIILSCILSLVLPVKREYNTAGRELSGWRNDEDVRARLIGANLDRARTVDQSHLSRVPYWRPVPAGPTA